MVLAHAGAWVDGLVRYRFISYGNLIFRIKTNIYIYKFIISLAHEFWWLCLQVGGYVQQYKGGFTFASVRGAGHMVPSSQADRALILLDSLLKGVLPPYVQEQ